MDSGSDRHPYIGLRASVRATKDRLEGTAFLPGAPALRGTVTAVDSALVWLLLDGGRHVGPRPLHELVLDDPAEGARRLAAWGAR